MLSKNTIAIKTWLLAALLGVCVTAHAGPAVGTVTDLSGPLLAHKPDGTVKILSHKSAAENGDLLISEKDTFARVKFVDNSEVTLRPGSQLRIDNFVYAEDKPQNDSSVFSLLRGGLRAVTGALGKRSREKVGVNTPAATIGIRGTTYIAEYIPPTETTAAAYGRTSFAALDESMLRLASDIRSDVPFTVQLAQAGFGGSSGGGLSPGLYVSVIDGMVQLTNRGGTQNFAAGQFGYTPSNLQPPVILPANPGIRFAPPPTFSMSTGPATSTQSGTQQGNVDCEVR